jgi:hypothetical protein
MAVISRAISPWLMPSQAGAQADQVPEEQMPPLSPEELQSLFINGQLPEEANQSVMSNQQKYPEMYPESLTLMQRTVAGNPMANAEDQRLYDQKVREALALQELGVRQLEENINQYSQQPTGPDLTGLAALADAWGPDKSNFVQAYKAPLSREEKNMRLLGLRDKLQERKESQAKINIDALKAKLDAAKDARMGGLQEEYMKARIAALKSGGGNAFQREKFDQALKSEIIKTDQYKDLQDQNTLLEKLEAYDKALSQAGISYTGENVTKLENAYNKLLTEYNRTGARLGALAGADKEILEKTISPATGVKGFDTEIRKGGASGIKNAIQKTKKDILSIAFRNAQALKTGYGDVATPFLTPLERRMKFSTYEKEQRIRELEAKKRGE